MLLVKTLHLNTTLVNTQYMRVAIRTLKCLLLLCELAVKLDSVNRICPTPYTKK